MKQVEFSKNLIQHLHHQGVKSFVVCPGARNAPIVEALSKCKNIQIHSFFDERSAGFFALGRAQSTNSPCVIITTSGTAVAELFPSIIESYYTETPIIAITADRPEYYRGKGAPQSIEQKNIFGIYSKVNIDIQNLALDLNFKISQNGPSHINVCFDEPLIDDSLFEWNLSPSIAKQNTIEKITSTFTTPNQKFKSLDEISESIKKITKPLVLVGKVESPFRQKIKKFLIEFNQPTYLEAQSGLREDIEISQFQIKSSNHLLTPEFVKENFSSIIRIGGIPTIRIWRDLELKLKSLPVFHFSSLNFQGIGRETEDVLTYEMLSNLLSLKLPTDEFFLSNLIMKDNKNQDLLNELSFKFPHAEPSIFRELSKIINFNDLIFLGNSLPIREWDLMASHNHPHSNIYSNRGTNGIDGLASTAFGLGYDSEENWIITGDLSALYDLNAPWSIMNNHKKWRWIVINNGGGKIFSPMFNNSLFENNHNLSLEPCADLWNLDYHLWRRVPDKISLLDKVLIEIRPNNKQTNDFWNEYNKFQSI